MVGKNIVLYPFETNTFQIFYLQINFVISFIRCSFDGQECMQTYPNLAKFRAHLETSTFLK